MKKYKIRNKVIYANSLHDALEIYKHKVKDVWTEAYKVFNKIIEEMPLGKDFEKKVNKAIEIEYAKHMGDPDWDEAYRRYKATDSKMKDAGELQYPAVSSTHPNIISSTLNHIEEELKYAKVEGDKRGKTRVFRMLSEAREYYDRYKKECDNFEKFVKEYRKYLEDQYKRIMNLDAEATNFKGW